MGFKKKLKSKFKVKEKRVAVVETIEPVKDVKEIKRIIPIDHNNEQFLLGHALNNEKLLDILLLDIKDDTFLYKNHKAIFNCFTYLRSKNLTVDIDTIETVKKQIDDGITIRLKYLGEMKRIFSQEITDDTYSFHVQKLRDDKVKDILSLKALPDFGKLLLNPKVSSENLIEEVLKLQQIIEENYVDNEFGFMNSESACLDYDAEIDARESGTVFGSTSFAKLDKFLTDGFAKRKMSIIAGRTGMGKCQSALTPILYHDGNIKFAKDVQIGDKLMGPDSKRRIVKSIHSGESEMYKITPNKGECWECNGEHILSLRMSADNGNMWSKNDIVEISINDYFKKNKKFKHHAKLWRTGVDFDNKNVEFDPYLIGLWLGDGVYNDVRIINQDCEILEYFESLKSNGFTITKHSSIKTPVTNISMRNGCRNLFLEYLRDNCKINNEKRIPKECLINDRENRFKILAGLIDTDGYLVNGCYEIITKYNGLCEDILFLVRSLGLAAYKYKKIGTIKSINFKGEYWKIIISGEISNVPCKVKRRIAEKRKMNKNVLNVGFNIKHIGRGKYYGFSVDKDHLFLLGDFTVTHNSALLINMFLGLAKTGIAVAFYNFEMDHVSMMDRLIAILANIPLVKIIKDRNKLTNSEKIIIEKARDEIGKMPIYFFGKSTQTLDGIKRELKILREKYNVQVVGYDLFDKIKFNYRRGGSDASVINDALKQIQGFGRDLDIHQVLIVQIGRVAEKRKNKRPRLSELKDAGGYEERADNVFLLYRADYYRNIDEGDADDIEVGDSDEMEIIIAKQRQGVANVKVMFDFFPATTTIDEPENDKIPERGDTKND